MHFLLGGNGARHASVPDRPTRKGDVGGMVTVEEEGRLTPASAKAEFDAVGGATGLTSGEWFLRLLARSLGAFHKNANGPYFRAKYPGMGDDAIAAKLTSVAARNAALIGGTAGLAVSADEIMALVSAGLALPGALAVAVGAVGVNIVSVTHIQLRLISSMAGLYGGPLDPDDPEDVLAVIKFFLLGKGADALRDGGTPVAKGLAKSGVKAVVTGKRREALLYWGKKAGLKILQKHVVNVAIPVVSIGLGVGSNYLSTRAIGRNARISMKRRADEFTFHQRDGGHASDGAGDAGSDPDRTSGPEQAAFKEPV